MHMHMHASLVAFAHPAHGLVKVVPQVQADETPGPDHHPGDGLVEVAPELELPEVPRPRHAREGLVETSVELEQLEVPGPDHRGDGVVEAPAEGELLQPRGKRHAVHRLRGTRNAEGRKTNSRQYMARGEWERWEGREGRADGGGVGERLAFFDVTTALP